MSLFEAKNLQVSFQRDGELHTLFSKVNLTLEASFIYDLIGESGSGKSTLLRACAQMIDYKEGEFFLDGVSSTTFPTQKWRRQVCLVPQKTSLVPGTVEENLVLPWKLKIHGKETPPSTDELERALQKAKLSDIELSRDVSQLSGGQAARISLLRVFLTKPRVLLLDEVDAALDDLSSKAISEMTAALIDENTACLRIRHRSSDGLAQGVFRMAQGNLTYQPSSSPHPTEGAEE